MCPFFIKVGWLPTIKETAERLKEYNMKTFREYVFENKNVSFGKKYRLAEMPARIPEIPKDKVIRDINSFWELAQTEDPKIVGKIGSEEVIRVGLNGIRYYFHVKNDKPTFFVGLDRRLDLSGWQISYVGKNNSPTQYESFLKFLIQKEKIFVVSGVEQSPVAEKIWKKILSKPSTKYQTFDDDTGKPVDVDLEKAWPSNVVFKIIKI